MTCKNIVLTGGSLNCFYLMSKYFIAYCPLCSGVVLDVFPYAARTKAVCMEKAVGSWLQNALLDVPLVVCQPGDAGAACTGL